MMPAVVPLPTLATWRSTTALERSRAHVTRHARRASRYFTGRSNCTISGTACGQESLQDFWGIGLATSDDGLNFTLHSKQPVILGNETAAYPANFGVAGGGSILEDVAADGSRSYRQWYTLAVGRTSKDVKVDQKKVCAVAHSRDGIAWFNHSVVLSETTTASNNREDIACAAPVVWRDVNGTYRMIYSAIGTRWGFYSLAQAVSKDGYSWSRGVAGGATNQDLVLGPNKVNATPGVAQFDSQMVEYASVWRCPLASKPWATETIGLFYAGNGYGRGGLGYTETMIKTDDVAPQLILCKPSASLARWLPLPTASGPAVALRLASHPALCAVAGKGSLGLGSCDGAPKFRLVRSKRYPTRGYNVAAINGSGNATGACLDARGEEAAQLYKCLDSANQGWTINTSTGAICETFDRRDSVLGLSSDPACAPAPAPEPKPKPKPKPPAARGLFCPRFHPIGSASLYDPSGPIFDERSGIWHLFEDYGGWSNFSSTDLMNWRGTLKSSTHFGGLTGSIAATPSGIYAFWPGRAGTINRAVCEDCGSGGGWSNWSHRGSAPGLVEPKREKAGSFRDPARAFQHNGSWFVGVGSGQSTHDPVNGGGAVCLFRATNDSLAEFTDAGTLFRTNHSFGSFSKGTVVYNRSHDLGFNMIECPDIFELGGPGSWVLIASIAHGGGPNQWFTGSLQGDPPTFVPQKVGVLDYGNGYAAKTGSTLVQNGSSRRVMFGFTGWAEPTAPQSRQLGGGPQAGCGRYLVLPRELTVKSGGLHIAPVPETAVLRVAGSATRGTIDTEFAISETSQLAAGSHVEIEIVCNRTAAASRWPSTGKVALRTLASADGAHFTEVGWDFGRPAEALYVNHTRCCANISAIVQRALTLEPLGEQMRLRTFADGGMIEAFAEGVVITALLNPDSSRAGGGPPEGRASSVRSTAAGVRCRVQSYKLTLKADDEASALIQTADPTPQFKLNLLTSYPDAKCLDGSPGAYYSYRQENVDRWLIYIEGGAWCFTSESCASRAKGQLGSSLTYLKNFSRDSGHGHNPVLLGGITSSNCTVNPTFCRHNVIFVKYCDGASFTGSTSAGGLHYRGFDVLTALLTDLKTKQGISDASEVLLTGGSAGGMSVFLHADRVRKSLELRPGAKFGAVPLSGFFLDRENVYGEPVFHGQAMGMYALANSSSGVPRSCVAERPDDPASCIFSEHAYNSIESPIFVVDSTLDAYQIPCIMGRNGTASTWANSSCGAARDYENCTKIWGDRPLNEHCSRTQMYTLVEYQGSFMRKISTKKAWTKPNNGAFLYQCFTHVAANYPSFNVFYIDGVSMQQAVTKWWESLGTVDRDAAVYVDGIWGLDGVSTNPTCTY